MYPKAIWLKSKSKESAARSYWIVTCQSKYELYGKETVYFGTLREVLKATKRTMRAHIFELGIFLTQLSLAQKLDRKECRINAVKSNWRRLGTTSYTRVLCVQGITERSIVNAEVRYIVEQL